MGTETQQSAGRAEAQEGGVDVSVVIPSYNENESLPELSARLKDVLGARSAQWEVWFIDDGSHDGSVDTLRRLHAEDARFKMVRFRRNYGKSAALAVGFERARGNYVITMDA
ncbi:MAG: glycosyltransferase, partial [Bacteroidota bacterium]|nr:glycosyltransferase [Bacteroidota bacterium]